MNKIIEDIKINHNIISYLVGETTEQENIKIQEWINAAPENKAYFEKIKELWSKNLTDKENRRFESIAGWNKFKKKYNFLNIHGKVNKEKSSFKTITFNVLKVAAILAIGIFIWQSGLFKTKTISLSTVNNKEAIVLPDNSTVFLNKNSKISYNANLHRKNTRVINFSGEAFFDIIPNPDKPFIIYTNNVKVEVKGTSFNIRSYPGDKVEVTVKSGIVKVTELSDKKIIEPVELKQGEKITIDNLKDTLSVKENDNPNYLSWKTESYTFDSVYISQVISSLQKGFDTIIIVKNPEFNNCMLVAKFDSLNLNEILWILQRTYNISVSNKNDTVIIQGKGCN